MPPLTSQWLSGLIATAETEPSWRRNLITLEWLIKDVAECFQAIPKTAPQIRAISKEISGFSGGAPARSVRATIPQVANRSSLRPISARCAPPELLGRRLGDFTIMDGW
jgi:hypothetical protein